MDDASSPPPTNPHPPGETDWVRIAALTDEEIARAVAEDPDAAPILDEATVRREYRSYGPRLPRP